MAKKKKRKSMSKEPEMEIRVTIIQDTNASLAALQYLLYIAGTGRHEQSLMQRKEGEDDEISNRVVRSHVERRRTHLLD